VLQVVDLLESKAFQDLDLELLSIAPDSSQDWANAAAEYDVYLEPSSSPTGRTRSPRDTT